MRKNIVVFLILILSMLVSLAPVQAAVSNNPSNIYVVKSGDSLPGIASQYQTTVDELKLTNGLQKNSLLVGQKLWVPIKYEVQAQDSLRDIATRYHSSVELIKTENGLSSDQVQIGQILKVPPKRMVMQGQYILMTKEEFRDWLFHQQFSRKIRLVQQHHTWLPSYKQFYGNNHFKMLKSMETYHMKKKGWKNIAQNITTFPDGKIAVSRPFDIAPEGSIGSQANSVGIAIENVGNFDLGQDEMSKEQKESIVYVTALLCLKFGLTPSIDTITYHHWWNYRTKERVLDNSKAYEVKTCPGTGFFGGNTTNSAKTYFYPLVLRKMQEIKASKSY